uniref:uncharacterized protein LOC100180613 isoform X2 n=1 Tax=Ciona intestinalis TaxID=7719 RepID=UPI000EF4B92E|nr:uncharacterized protein LOC100180613 isoform X2 [Ciona intestinalis]|eukprot:XP_026690011.1 uncharacterized protein LOC100180613 isoform X2 [Ciona intestinalis]
MEKQIKRNHSCKHKICRRTRYRNYKFCYLHILDDKSAPFTTCQYISNVTKRKCSNPALKPDRSNSTVPCLCEIHNNAKSQTNRIKYRSHRKKNSKLADRDYQPTLLQKLRKHHKSNDGEAKHNTDDESGQPYDLAMEQLELDTYENRQWVTGLSTSWKSGEADIDVDLVEDLNNPLKYAGAYTAEEVISMSKDRLVRLQSLYIDQFKHLHRTLQEGRRKYLVDKSIEEQQGSSHSSSKQLSSRSEHHHLHELKSLVGFRRRSGEEILLHKKLKKRRLEITKGKTVMPLEAQPHRSRCSHVTKNTRCKSSCLPYTKYCTAHILEDPLQIMYKKCNWKGCTIPVCVMSLEQSKQKAQCFCPAHRKLPEFSQKLEKLVSNIGEANTVIVTDNVSVKEETKEQDVEIAEVLGDILTTVEDGLNIINMETLIEPKEEMVNGIEDDKEEVIPIPPPVVDDTPMILVEEDSMGVEEHQVESHPPMDVDPPEDVDFSKSSSVINSISTGQLFMVSNSPDEGALHLEPLIPSLSSHGHTVSVLPSENNNDSCEKFLREKGYAENAETESRQSVTLEIGDAKQSKSIEAKVQHQGAIISVSNERTKYEKTSKKIVTTTLVPPVETKRETSDKEEHLEEDVSTASNISRIPVESLPPPSGKPPPLALLPSVKLNMKTVQSRETSSSVHMIQSCADHKLQSREYNEPKTDEISKVQSPVHDEADSCDHDEPIVHKDESSQVPPTTSDEKLPPTCEVSTLVSTSNQDVVTTDPIPDVKPPREQNKEDEYHDSSDSSMPASPASKSVSPMGGDRKPSSADEETAVASLLSLCSATER